MTDDPLLDLKATAERLTAETGRTVTLHAVRHMSRRKKDFPFFKDPLSGRIVIRESDLLAAWQKAEREAKHRVLANAGEHDRKAGRGGKA